MTVNEKLQKNQYTTVEINISLIHMYMYLKDITKVKIVYKRSQWTNRQQSTITNLIIQRKTDRIKIECVYCQYAFPNNKWATTTASHLWPIEPVCFLTKSCSGLRVKNSYIY